MSNFIKGDVILLDIWDGVDTYDPIACLTSNSLSEVRNIIESQTKCNTVLGPELVSDVGFDTPGDWGASGAWVVSGSKATKSPAASALLTNTGSSITVAVGDKYRVDVSVESGIFGAPDNGLYVGIGVGGTDAALLVVKNGRAIGNFTNASLIGSHSPMMLVNDDSFSGDVTSFSLKQILSEVPTIIKDAGSLSNEITFEGQDIDASLAVGDKVSHKGLALHLRAADDITWRMHTGLTDTPYYYGTGFISDLSLDASAGDELVTFSGTIAIGGSITTVDPN